MILALLLATSLAQGTAPTIPVPIEIRIPEYPEGAVKAQISGTVEITVSVSPNGTVERSAVAANALPVISTAALRAAREWRFAAQDGSEHRPYVIRFEFVLDVDASYKGDLCSVGPSSAVVLLPLQTVRIRGWLRPPQPTSTSSQP